jgi:molybdopterin converting factor small subunit
MRINVEFLGMPAVSDVVGKKKLEVDVSGLTVKDVIDELIKRYGEKVKKAFYPEGNFDLMIQIAIDGKYFIPADKHDTPLHEGDLLTFMMLIAGG